MGVWDSEDALDAILVADSDLDVIFDAEGGAVVECRPLDKNALDCIERRLAFFVLKTMKIVQNGTVEIVTQAIGLIFRQRKPGLSGDLLEQVKSSLRKLEAAAGREIETIAQIDYGSDDSRLRNLLRLSF